MLYWNWPWLISSDAKPLRISHLHSTYGSKLMTARDCCWCSHNDTAEWSEQFWSKIRYCRYSERLVPTINRSHNGTSRWSPKLRLEACFCNNKMNSPTDLFSRRPRKEVHLFGASEFTGKKEVHQMAERNERHRYRMCIVGDKNRTIFPLRIHSFVFQVVNLKCQYNLALRDH